MPVPEERLYKPDRLNRWFAVASVLMTASIIWFIWVDYDRPWRYFQDDYFVGKAALAHLDYLDAMREERQQEIEDAKQRLEDARQYVLETYGPIRAELEADLVEADLKFRRAEAPWSRLRQVIDVSRDTFERLLETKGADHPDTVAARKTFLDQSDELERLRKEKEHWEDLKKDIERRLRDLESDVRLAEARVRDLQMDAENAKEKDQQFRGVLTDEGLLGGLPIVRMLINFPLLDFTAPKNTPGRHQVNQLVLPEVRQRLNYLETYTTDRCTTCHIGIDDPDFSIENLASKLEQSLPGINEALQRDGRDPYPLPAPPVVSLTGETLPAGQVTAHWGELDRDQQQRYFDDLLVFVNQYLKSTGRKEIQLGQPILAHPDLDLYVDIDSPHPMNRVGCTVCHEGNPQETDFVQAAHSPPTHEIQEQWEDEYYQRRLGVPNVTFETVSHYWDRMMRLPQYTEAGCAKCHVEITDIARFEGEHVGSRINLGEHLFREVGCINCHNVENLADSRKVGPDLTYVASKLTPEFVQPWVLFPKDFRPSTLMPHFFYQENNRDQSANRFDPEPELRTETEVAAISKYLFAVSQDWSPKSKPESVVGDVERGRQLFSKTGCTACHANINEFGEEWITADLVQRKGLDRETATYRYRGMTQEERVTYAMEHFVDARDTLFHPDKARFEGGSEYTPPIFSRYAPELSGVGSKVEPEWLYSWLLEPTHYAPDTKMPSLRLSPSEAADLTAYLMTLRNDAFHQGAVELTAERRQKADDLMFDLLSAQRSERRSRGIMNDEGDELTQMLVSLVGSSPSFDEQRAYELIRPMTLEDKKLMFLGNKMILHYGCYACHKIAGFENATQPGTDLSAWAEKPITQLDFAFYDHAFHHMREERDEVFGYIYPRDAELLNESSPLPEDAREEITHTHHAFAKHKMLNPRIWDRNKLKRPYDKLKMPNYFFTEREAEALTTYLLSRIPPRVTDELQVDYETTVKGPIAEGRFLTRELNCIACHQIEDNVPTIQQYFRRELAGELRFDETNAPPSLIGEGAKIQHKWLHRFLNQVEPLRPWLEVRMPSFKLTGEDSTQLAAYFASMSQRDASTLEELREPIAEYIQRAHAAQGSNGEKAERAGDDWFMAEGLRDQTDALRRFAVERRLIRPQDLNPLKASQARLVDAHRNLLERVEFLQQLYQVEYPFVEPPAPMSSPERLEMGMQFITDMGCLKCHVLGPMLPGPANNTDEFAQVYRLDGVRGEGDQATAILNGSPYQVGSVIDGHTLVSAENIYYDSGDIETKAIIEGPAPDGGTERILLQAPSAPNLGLTYERLRRDWVHAWMLNPQWIQPGTKMPQNFVGGVSPFEGDPDYPGTSSDHIDLIVDALFDAGRSNLRAPQPKIVAPSMDEEFEEDGEEFFDE